MRAYRGTHARIYRRRMYVSISRGPLQGTSSRSPELRPTLKLCPSRFQSEPRSSRYSAVVFPQGGSLHHRISCSNPCQGTPSPSSLPCLGTNQRSQSCCLTRCGRHIRDPATHPPTHHSVIFVHIGIKTKRGEEGISSISAMRWPRAETLG